MPQPPKTSESEIVAAALTLLETKGLDGLSMRAIARRLGLAPNALYHRFPSRGALEDALVDFPGCAVVISHDRWFLDRIATHILAFEGDSETVWFEGNYQAYIEDLKRRKGADADQPHRIKYRRLVRT